MVQIEYALAAVASGAASVGIKATNGVVLATEKKHKSILYEEHSTFKVEQNVLEKVPTLSLLEMMRILDARNEDMGLRK